MTNGADIVQGKGNFRMGVAVQFPLHLQRFLVKVLGFLELTEVGEHEGEIADGDREIRMPLAV